MACTCAFSASLRYALAPAWTLDWALGLALDPGLFTWAWAWTFGTCPSSWSWPCSRAAGIGPDLGPISGLSFDQGLASGHALHLCPQSGVNDIVGFHDVGVGPTSFMYTTLSGFERS